MNACKGLIVFIVPLALAVGFFRLAVGASAGLDPNQYFYSFQDIVGGVSEFGAIRSVLSFNKMVTDWLLSLFDWNMNLNDIWGSLLTIFGKFGLIITAGVPAMLVIGVSYLAVPLVALAYVIRVLLGLPEYAEVTTGVAVNASFASLFANVPTPPLGL